MPFKGCRPKFLGHLHAGLAVPLDAEACQGADLKADLERLMGRGTVCIQGVLGGACLKLSDIDLALPPVLLLPPLLLLPLLAALSLTNALCCSPSGAT